MDKHVRALHLQLFLTLFLIKSVCMYVCRRGCQLGRHYSIPFRPTERSHECGKTLDIPDLQRVRLLPDHRFQGMKHVCMRPCSSRAQTLDFLCQNQPFSSWKWLDLAFSRKICFASFDGWKSDPQVRFAVSVAIALQMCLTSDFQWPSG